LVSKQGSGVSDSIRQNLEVACSISGKDPKASLSISIRTRVEDITQRLGSLELPQTPDTDGVDLFGWASQAIDRRDELEDDLIRGKSDAAASGIRITSLQAQLDDLVKAKTEHEDELLGRFAVLLNEKKLRLRELKRLMSTAKVDKKALERLEASLPASGLGSGKRGKKRTAPDTKGASESDDSDGFEAMDVDKPTDDAKAADSDKERHTTEDETETESDNDDLDHPVASQTERGEATYSRLPPKEQPPSLPPTRDLPFTKQKQAEKESKALPPPPDDEETASEDDEL
jgi:DNA double-strand break repair and V(D)J recombination protein XRCC4